MRHSRAAAIVCFLCLCLGLAGNAGAQETGFQAVPDVLRPGKMYSVEVNAPYTGGASLYLTGRQRRARVPRLHRLPRVRRA